MNGRNYEEAYLSGFKLWIEALFKRSWVSPLCIYMIPEEGKNARWNIV